MNSRSGHTEDLAARFVSLLARQGIDNGGSQVFESVCSYYDEPHRHYHNLDHIRHCLREFDAVRDLTASPDAVELAIWFHDVIYKVPSDENELKSALLFQQLVGCKITEEQASKVKALILATIHPSAPNDTDAKYVADIDLSSFGLKWEKFMEDNYALRRENRYLTDDQFAAAKLSFMGLMLSRPSFYLTEYFRERYEAQALSNVNRHMKDIRKQYPNLQ